MKKLLVVLLTLTVIGSLAFAEVTLSSWNRMGFMLYQAQGDVNAANELPSWGRNGISFSGKSDNMGIALDLNARNATGFEIGDNGKIYAKLANGIITVSVGKSNFDNLRGKIGGASEIAWGFSGSTTGDEDTIFKRLNIAKGIALELAPVAGLYAAATVSQATNGTADNAYEAAQIAAGYTIEGIGLIRAQFIGALDDPSAQAAFALTAVEGLTVDVGARFYFEDGTASQNVISGAVKYGKDALNAMVRGAVRLENSDAALDLDLGVGGYVNYKVSDTLIVGVDVAFPTIADNAKKVDAVPYVKLPLAGGFIMAGFAAEVGLDDQDFKWGVPVMLQAGF
jgi:hypothetical protein